MKQCFVMSMMIISVSVWTTGCVLWDKNRQQNQSLISNDSEHTYILDPQRLEQAIDEGSEMYDKLLLELQKTDSQYRTHKSYKKWNDTIVSLMINNSPLWSVEQLERAVNIYQFAHHPYPWLVFSYILKSEHPQAAHLAWQSLRSLEPNDHHRNMVDQILSDSLHRGQLERHLVIEMAWIIGQWKVVEVYDVVKLGLLSRGDVEYVKAMAVLKPQQATSDFLDYLALVPDHDLRQLSMDSIDSLTANAILVHLRTYLPELGHAHLEKIFGFAASRQMNLKNLATQIIDELVPSAPVVMAYLLSRQPHWVQYSVIEEARRSMTGNRKLLLTHLAQTTADQHIAQEIALAQTAGDGSALHTDIIINESEQVEENPQN